MAKCWAYPVGDATGQQIASDGTHVFVGLGGAKVEALSLDGRKIWSSEFGGEITSNILAAESGLFVVTTTLASDGVKPFDSRLRSTSKETGITNWTVTLPYAEEHFLGRLNGAVIVVSKNGTIQSIDARGSLKWKREIAAGFIAEPMFTLSDVIVATVGNQIFSLSMATGEIDKMRKVTHRITELSAGVNGMLIVGDERGNIVSLNGADKPAWVFKTGGQISNVSAVGENILAASHDNYVYFLRGRNGSRAWKMRLTGRVSSLAIYDDAYMFVSSFDEHRAPLVDLQSGKIAGQIVFDDDEIVIRIRAEAGQPIFVLTNKAVNAYSIGGCPQK